MNAYIKRFFSIRVILISLVIWIGLCLLVGGSFFMAQPSAGAHAIPSAIITIVYLPTHTPLPTPGGTQPALTPGSSDAIHVGSFVQISGTGGEGLRIRSAPGIENTQLFVAKESEAFEVKDGPVAAGDYTWWFVVSKTDASRGGWAAGNYLTVVNP